MALAKQQMNAGLAHAYLVLPGQWENVEITHAYQCQQGIEKHKKGSCQGLCHWTDFQQATNTPVETLR